jgi:hypothetical protein
MGNGGMARSEANGVQGGVGNRITSRSKYGTKKPKTAAA